MSQSSASNRRASARQKPRHSVRFECRGNALGLGPNISTKLLDLSQGGCCFVSKASLEKQSEVEVMITGMGLPKGLKRIGNVCWIVPIENGAFCVGVKFQKHLEYRDFAAIAIP